MIRFALRRIFYSAVLVLIVLTIIFFMAKLSPGDPFSQYYRPEIDPQFASRMRRQFGLDSSSLVQFCRWLWNFIHGEFGMSFSQNRPVRSMLMEAVPRTLQLTLLALALQTALGLVLGVFMAARRNTAAEKGLKIIFLGFYSIPTFYFAYLLIALMSLKLQWLPSANMFSFHLQNAGLVRVALDRASHMVLPVSVLAVGGAAALARFTRGSILDCIKADYITTAKAKGLSESRILWIHALRNALAPVLTIIGLGFPFLLGGSFVVEKIFAWPGMGAMAVDAIFARDYPVIMAAGFIGAVMVILGNLFADISYAFADPRIKGMGKSAGWER